MEGPNPPYYTPVPKPHASGTGSSSWRRTNFFSLAVITFFCTVSYLFGVWQHSGNTNNNLAPALPCVISSNTSTTVINKHSVSSGFRRKKKIDFTGHHSAIIPQWKAAAQSAEKIQLKNTTDVKYSEYTPCEDQHRSLKFPRDLLIYRERHCPEKNELLKYRIPAPHGYKNPFKWPDSRDLAWYANVPHKELAVEKAVQNWIRYDGKRFRFLDGGTMFPNGANAYIDDIDKLINLKDGSIRTAIDSCGV